MFAATIGPRNISDRVQRELKKPSVGLKLKIPKEPQLLYFGTENFEQLRFQSIYVPIPKL